MHDHADSTSRSTPVIGVLGLGYVGLPLAVSFAKHYRVVGFDIKADRVAELAAGHDRTLEVSDTDLRAVTDTLTVTADPAALQDVDIYIITTPTPIDEHKNPDLAALLAASRTVGESLAVGNLVIYESTVYPGATEEDCVPVLERVSGLRFNEDFCVGYSPERINPGDREHRFETILKVTSGSTPEAAQRVDELYASVVTAGTFLASSIRVAEAAKIIENTQRDVNIALINELAQLFNRLGIDTREVLDAAGTKWNFLPFQPGLVGGHCIGVDPYYLTHKARAVGFHPEVILAGRRINDSMGAYVASELVMALLRHGIDVRSGRILLMGLSFKEDTPDVRNTRVIDIYRELTAAGLRVDVYDPWVDPREALSEYGLELVIEPDVGGYQGVVLTVAHQQFKDLGSDGVRKFASPAGSVVYDLKGVLPAAQADLRL